MAIKNLRLKRGKEESLDRFHPWVFSGALAEPLPEGLEEGETVRVTASDGRVIGVGHFQIGSIAVRILDFADTTIDLKRRLSCGRPCGSHAPTTMHTAWCMARGIFCPGWLLISTGLQPLFRHTRRGCTLPVTL